MQSDNRGDAGYRDLVSKPDRVALLVPPSLRNSLSCANMNAAGNITAGVGYLLSQAAQFSHKFMVTDQKIRTVTIEKHDSLSRIASNVHSSEDLIKSLNPQVNFYNLQPGTVLKYQIGKTVAYISGWKSIDETSIYSLYNRNPRLVQRYTQQLRYAYSLIKRNRLLQ